MNELDRMTRIAGYMVLTILVMAIGGLFIPNDQTKVIPKPVVEEISYEVSYSYEPIKVESSPTPSPTKSIYYPNSYGDDCSGDSCFVDYDLFDDEDDIESYYEEED
jgi:hypothetical protein